MNRIFILLVLSAALSSCVGKPMVVKTAAVVPELRPFYKEMQRHVAMHIVYPPDSLAAHEQGACEIRFRFRRDGSMVSSEILKSTGFPRLDAACLQVGRDVPEFPAIPESVDPNHQEFLVEMPINFKFSS